MLVKTGDPQAATLHRVNHDGVNVVVAVLALLMICRVMILQTLSMHMSTGRYHIEKYLIKEIFIFDRLSTKLPSFWMFLSR
jgi:hypothetical protein